jgi:hypothetical protein
VQWALEAMLQAPSFLYRRELGQNAGSGLHRLDGWEVATELSYLLRDASLDDALVVAAASGALDTPDGIAREVSRLLEDPLVQDRVVAIYARLFEVARVTHADHTDAVWNDALRSSAATEVDLLLAEQLFGGGEGSLRALLTTTQGYADPALGQLYGVEVTATPGEHTAVTLPSARAGILARVAFLAGNADVDDTSVVRRGLFVSRSLLCDEIAPPPAGVLDAARDDLAALDTERERAEYRADTSGCSSCHVRIDPLGLAFEGFDAVGREQAVDASATLVSPDSIAGPVDGAQDLQARLAESAEVRACVARQLAGYALGRAVGAADADTVADVVTAFEEHQDLTDLFVSVARADAFRYRMEVSP